VLAVCAGCGRSPSPSATPAADAPSASEASTLRRGNGPEPDSLDPQRARTDSGQHILRDLFEGLTAVGPDSAPVPAAAETWTVSDDGLEYRFRLREGLHWSNGDPLVAEDFVAGMRRLVDPATASQYAQILEPVVAASAIVRGERPPADLGVSAPDERTVVVRVVSPTALPAGARRAPKHFPGATGRRSRRTATSSRVRAGSSRTARSCSRTGSSART
jgi:ABC-type oligopeptide transport system substrate-binding subunit